MTTRASIRDRAGTHIKKHEPIFGTGKDKRQIGTLDPEQRVFQAGGELSKFLYRQRMWLSLPWDVWEQIRTRIDFIEIVDHEANQVFRTHISTAVQFGGQYKNSLGPRFGLHVKHWACYDKNGQLLLKEWNRE